MLLHKVYTQQFISTHQFVRATHFCLLAEYFMSESLLTLVRMQILLHECACVSKHVNVYMNASRACRSVCFLFLCVYECVVVKRVRKKNTNLCDFTSAAQCFSLCPSVILSVRSGGFQQHKICPQEIMCGHTWRLPNLLQQSYSRGGSRGYPLSEWLEWRRGAMDGKGGRQEGLDGEGSGGIQLSQVNTPQAPLDSSI